MTRILMTYDSTNRTVDGHEVHDASGAFIPQAVVAARVRRAMGDSVYTAPCNTVAETLAAIRAAGLEGRIDAWWYFGHGTRDSLPSIQAHASDIPALAEALLDASHRSGELRVALFACSTGASRFGFASAFARALRTRGFVGWLDAHTTAQHTTENPYVVRFYMRSGADLIEPGETSGVKLVDDHERLWMAWRDALVSDQRFRFTWPLEAVGDIRNELAKRASPEVA